MADTTIELILAKKDIRNLTRCYESAERRIEMLESALAMTEGVLNGYGKRLATLETEATTRVAPEDTAHIP